MKLENKKCRLLAWDTRPISCVGAVRCERSRSVRSRIFWVSTILASLAGSSLIPAPARW